MAEYTDDEIRFMDECEADDPSPQPPTPPRLACPAWESPTLRRLARERARAIRGRRERGIERKPGRTATAERALNPWR